MSLKVYFVYYMFVNSYAGWFVVNINKSYRHSLSFPQDYVCACRLTANTYGNRLKTFAAQSYPIYVW